MRSNTAATLPKIRTHEGAPAMRIRPEDELKRTVLSCLLWEQSFYESGEDIAKRITELVGKVSADYAFAVAEEARAVHNLRHAPLWIAVAMARKGGEHRRLLGMLLPSIIRRADELAEFVSLYWKDGKVPLAKQVKAGLAAAFRKFDEYSLAKYNRDNAIKLRDVLFLCHAKPDLSNVGKGRIAKPTKYRGSAVRHEGGHGSLWKKLIDGELKTPDTWEVGISAAKTKEERLAVWNRLLDEKKLFALATLKNLRNMIEDGVDVTKLTQYVLEMDARVVLPFRYIAAARYNPRMERALEKKMLTSLFDQEKMKGKTAIVVDVSGSMNHKLSARSDMMRTDAAYGLAMIGRELFEDVRIFAFSERVKEIPARRGFALRDAIDNSMPHSSTYLGEALERVKKEEFDRIIVITDEQSHDRVQPPGCRGYMINVGTDKNGVGYGKWVHMDGFSEAVVKWIREYEKML